MIELSAYWSALSCKRTQTHRLALVSVKRLFETTVGRLLCGLFFFKRLFSALVFFSFFCFPPSTPLPFSTVIKVLRVPRRPGVGNQGWFPGIASYGSAYCLGAAWSQWRPLDIPGTHLPLSSMQLLIVTWASSFSFFNGRIFITCTSTAKSRGKAAICSSCSPVQFLESLHSHKMHHFAEALFDLSAESYKYLEPLYLSLLSPYLELLQVIHNHAKGSQQRLDEQYTCFDVIKVCNLSFKIVIPERTCLLYAVAKN